MSQGPEVENINPFTENVKVGLKERVVSQGVKVTDLSVRVVVEFLFYRLLFDYNSKNGFD